MEYLGVLLAAVGAFAFAAVWYMSLSKYWIRAAGIPVDENGRPMGNGSALPFLIGFVALLLVAGMMRHIFATSGITTLCAGALAGAGVGAFLITPWVTMNYAFAARKPMLAVIDGGNSIAGCTIIGLILTLF